MPRNMVGDCRGGGRLLWHSICTVGIRYRSGFIQLLWGLLDTPLLVDSSLEFGNVWQDFSDISFSNSPLVGSLLLGLGTMSGRCIWPGDSWREAIPPSTYSSGGRIDT